MKYDILICGAGQLGSRYLQGISKLRYNYNVYVFDISEKSIERAKERWNDVKKNRFFKKIFFIKNFNLIPKKIDFAIVSSLSSVRLDNVISINKNTNVNYWILEKVLAQNESQIKKMESLIYKSKGSWVNKPRREMSWYNIIKSKINVTNKIKIEIKGGKWGLLSNAIHFIDLASWITTKKLTRIDSSNLDSNWFESKRKGFYETYGFISCEFENGSTLNIDCKNDDSPLFINIYEKNYSWKISEINGKALRSDGLQIQGKIEMQSEITQKIITKIIQTGDCSLPKLVESANMHSTYLNNLLSNNNLYENILPIT
ncbi:MAG: hypothetical protein CMC38_05685 [Flavobacteriaceae bacterium]|nr:hypothetical protein [Flavobacteriaceae bacterium]|tara:strand:+ start:199 stop:1143 length:945 start_codon:yes stop_codon:yes gene_type:complete